MGVNAVLDRIDRAIGEVEEQDQVKAEALALREGIIILCW